MRQPWTPSIVPRGTERLPGGGRRLGRVWREADVEATDLETVIRDLLEGQYKDPVRVIGFNPAEGWSQDVSEDVAQELRRRCDLQLTDVPTSIQDFVERQERYDRQQLTLRAMIPER